MKQEDKELLLKDLSERLPYGVKIKDLSTQADTTIDVLGIKKPFIIVDEYSRFGNVYDSISVEFVKPYLRPMSSMTEEEKEFYASMFLEYDGGRFTEFPGTVVEWLNKNMFDYNGLIPMGLALEAKEGMYD